MMMIMMMPYSRQYLGEILY